MGSTKIRTSDLNRRINLKDLVFAIDFLSLSQEQKQSHLGIRPVSENEIGPGHIPPKIQRTLQDLHSFKAKEVRYLNSGNKSQWKKYHEETEVSKSQLLRTWEENFYEKYLRDIPQGKPAPIPMHDQIPERSAFIPLIQESELGQRIKETLTKKVSQDLKFVVSRRFRISSWESLWGDLKTNHGLSQPKIEEYRKKIFTPQSQLDFLTDQMHWEPRTAWRYMKRFGSFQPYRDPGQGQTWVKLREREAAKRKELWDSYLREKRQLFENPTPHGTQKRSQLSLLQLGFVLTGQKLWAEAHAERTQFFERTISAQYSSKNPGFSEPVKTQSQFGIESPWIHRVERTGAVTYWRNSKLSMTDADEQVKIHDESDIVLETALRLAVLKFGNRLQVEGSQEFRVAIARTAARMKLRVSLGDPDLDEMRKTFFQRTDGLQY